MTPTSLTDRIAPAIHTAPARFDVHAVDAFSAFVASVDRSAVLDLGEVRFMDGAALDALVRTRAELIERGDELWLGDVSVAARITLELAGLAEALPSFAPDTPIAIVSAA